MEKPGLDLVLTGVILISFVFSIFIIITKVDKPSMFPRIAVLIFTVCYCGFLFIYFLTIYSDVFS